MISSLLDLQEENLAGKNVCNISKVREAFKESRDRIASMTLIHEELYRSTDTNSLDFSDYIKKLVSYLFNSYKHRTDDISLKLNIEEVHLEMDIAIPLGSVATELISNAFKYAFPDGSKGEISIFIFNKENYKKYLENLGDIRKDSKCRNIEDFEFIFIIKDNGIGLPKEIEFKNADTLGFQLVNTLIDQIDGCIELKNNKGAEFIIWFDHIKT